MECTTAQLHICSLSDRERLERLGAQVLGIVVNGVRELAGSTTYGYGHYLKQPVKQ